MKIHVAVVDIRKKKIVSLEVTSEEVHDSRVMKKKLIDHASENNNVKRVVADDGAYDSKKNFRYLHVNDIEAAIKVKKNSSGKAMGCCYPRKILQYCSNYQILEDGGVA